MSKTSTDKDFTPFADDVASHQIGDITFENGTERVAVYGDMTITNDRDGLDKATYLADMFARIAQTLKATPNLSLKVAAEPRPEDAPTVPNPFG